MVRSFGRALLMIVSLTSLLPSTGHAETLRFQAILKSADEVPPVKAGGSGFVEATYDTETHILSWRGGYVGLTGPAAAAHFHGPAGPGANAGVMLWISANIRQC